VSKNGKKLINFNAGLNVQRPESIGGFGGARSFTSGPVSVKSDGTFKVSGNLYAAGPGQKKLGTETVTGKFVSSTKATGKVASHFGYEERLPWRHPGPHGHRQGFVTVIPLSSTRLGSVPGGC
jgi:hypothetical protein